MAMYTYTVEIEREENGDWVAKILELPGKLPGVMAYGVTEKEAEAKVLLRLVAKVMDQADQADEASK